MVSDKNFDVNKWLDQLVAPIGDDLLSGAAEIALQAIVLYKTVLASPHNFTSDEMKKCLEELGRKLNQTQPAMASLMVGTMVAWLNISLAPLARAIA